MRASLPAWRKSHCATEEIAEELMKNGFSLGGRNMNATIMFADIRSFTKSIPVQIYSVRTEV
jgi:hypothetical protein